MASLSSLLQASGRVNRSESREGSTMVSFRLREENGINRNRGMEDSIRVLQQLFGESRAVSADLCTEALRRELRLDPGAESLLSKISTAENVLNFPEVEKLFRIIGDNTRTVVVGYDLVRRIESFESVDWREIQKRSVQIWGYRIENLHIPELNRHPGVYAWHLAYSPFLGIMEGILGLEDFERNGGAVL
jgi:CRISPR-associated endonuclease/helicase Cas3